MIYGIGLVFLIYYFIASDNYAIFLLLFVWIMIPILLGFYLLYAKRKITGEILWKEEMILREGEMIVLLRLINKGILPVLHAKVSFRINNTLHEHIKKESLFFFLPPKKEKEEIFQLPANHCGVHYIENISGMIYDPFCFWKGKINLYDNKQDKIVVIPKSYPLFIQLINTGQQGEQEIYSAIKSGEDSSELYDIRKYQEGDRLQKIHWKLTSKKGEILVKEYGFQQEEEYAIYLKLSKEKEETDDNLDLRIEIAFSFSEIFLEQGISHELVWYDKSKEKISKASISNKKEQENAIARILETSAFQSGEEQKELASFYMERERKGLLYITTNYEEDVLELLLGNQEMEKIHIIYTKKVENEKKKWEFLPIPSYEVTNWETSSWEKLMDIEL